MNTNAPVSVSYPPFRRPTFRRANSPPTWACYEQIHTEDDDSDSASDCASCSEDGEDYHPHSDVDNDNGGESEEESECAVTPVVPVKEVPASTDADTMDIEMEDDSAPGEPVSSKEDVKGKQRAVDPPEDEESSPRKHRHHHRRRREPVVVHRPILTIQKSQGFLWNQDLFVPPYIKDRYIASTSPPSGGLVSSSNTSLNGYEVEVVEIRVGDGDLAELIP